MLLKYVNYQWLYTCIFYVGPQQWDQTGSVDNQSGQFPNSTLPQNQYTQMDQQGQVQHGAMLYSMIVLYDY